jgi:type IV pilus assembly protein PilF
MTRPTVRAAALFCACLILVTGCVSTGGGPVIPSDGARPPMSSRPAVGVPQTRAKVHTELGALYLLEGRLAVAQEEARIAVQSDPTYAPGYNLMALVHMQLNEPQLAEENFSAALRHAPGDPEVFNNYGWFLCQAGRGKQAMEYFNAAAKNPLYPTPSKPNTNAGMCAIQLKDYKVAETYLATAMRLDGANTLALYWLAEAVFQQGRMQDARQWINQLEKALELPAEATWLALRIERKLGNREAEARYTARLKRVFPTAPETIKMLQGDYQ